MDRKDFFLVVAPGLSSLAQTELTEKWPQIMALAREYSPTLADEPLTVEAQTGGLLIKGLPLLSGALLNVYLKIPTRILIRLAEFRCRDFPKLFNKCKKLDWANWLDGGSIKISVSAHRSRLMMLKRIEETVLQAASGSKKKIEDPLPTNRIFVRFADDTCTISIDTSGEALYKRTEEKKIGAAPIRETLAAALFYQLWLLIREQGVHRFIDPMLGSGTALREAASFWRTHNRTAYAFSHFREIRTLNIDPTSFTDRILAANPIVAFAGFDKSAKAVVWAQSNLIGFDFSASERDLFATEGPVFNNNESSMVFVNPPYGKRIKISGSMPNYVNSLWTALDTAFAPSIAGIIVLREFKASLRVPKPYSITKILDFQNGGLKVSFVIIQK